MELKPIMGIAQDLGIDEQDIESYGKFKAKISLDSLTRKKSIGSSNADDAKLILVSAMTPTPAGEGKTTTSIGLAQGLRKLGRRSVLALRQPSMGPVFGRKGGATGGGKSTIQPSDSINLQFTGDFHAITAAHNLLSAAIDNKIHFGQSDIDPLKVLWKRAIDMNDRSLRSIVIGLGGKSVGGTPRQTGFDITAASEIMAILCLADSRANLRERLDRILIGYSRDDRPIFAKEIGVTGAMMAILNEAIQPNLVQSVEGVPTFVHGGPFANIAHGCNSILATKMALRFGEFAITEAGFAFDLGAEKFMSIKSRAANLNPAVIVIVATVRALKMHGGMALNQLNEPNVTALKRGLANLAAHCAAAKQFLRPVVVAINQRTEDSVEELAAVHEFCKTIDVKCSTANVFGLGGEGALDLAKTVVQLTENQGELPDLNHVYQLSDSIEEKIRKIATKIYGAKDVSFVGSAKQKIKKAEALGFGSLPVCMAKTQNSLSDDPKLLGRPDNFTLTVRDIEIASGAGFIVVLTGDIVRMPGLPLIPAAEKIDVDESGKIFGLT
ncbi:MAG: formate--tetrahydrofolate ligase [Proteobacteria bacterium]|nr:formate--tetrahydrofolate ligase [Pseudomonadota bacterium]